MSMIRVVVGVVGFILSSTGASLIFKVAAERSGWAAGKFYILGNVVGVFAPIFMMLALKNTNPNLIYAACLGGGFCLLQIASFLIFRQPLSTWQWAGVATVAAGILLLQVR